MNAMRNVLSDPNPCQGDAACQCETGKYYVGCSDGGSYYLMAGPYATHQAAEAHQELALKIADGIDGRAWFMSWGVVRMPDDCEKIGRLNQYNLI